MNLSCFARILSIRRRFERLLEVRPLLIAPKPKATDTVIRMRIVNGKAVLR